MYTVLETIRNNKITRCFWKALLIMFVNICVDAVDPNPQHIPENLSINDQESVVELIFESLLGYENIIEEFDDEDQKKSNSSSNQTNDYWNFEVFTDEYDWGLKMITRAFFSLERSPSSGYSFEEAPPPRSC